ncbi:glycosyltransferase family A protein [Corynebacterium heidelbergense]|uniref:4,4'-diaponeurosporenoate glycosyltransferase n=1 Tax=Corynebacterium heidelbergense TaxID=2055947 RepID=A0A364VAW2_9CORY|nr:glycosyltransferase family A protein [Corynebacterium heidelbergense]RAV33706.1 glycosyltransferase [Corynebacterium heidelbergense]WCZ35746.1 putative glycosyltransferase EpsJ [Corynebacterium heidelbergense]
MSQSQPHICVVIPVLNDAPLLRTCLHALAKQTLPATRIIVVDNGSTDNIREVTEAAIHRGLPLSVIQEPKKGIPFAAARGYDAALRLAAGPVPAHCPSGLSSSSLGTPPTPRLIILRCDADSTPAPTWIERHCRTLQAQAERGSRRIIAVTGVPQFPTRPGWLGRAIGAAYIGSYQLSCGSALGHPALYGSNFAMDGALWAQARERVHLSKWVHDDYDLSFQVLPGQTIAVDWGSAMPVSWRAAVTPRRVARQVVQTFVTLGYNWRVENPGERLRSRMRELGRMESR